MRKSSSLRAAKAVTLTAALLAASADRPLTLESSTLRRIAEVYESKVFSLKVDLHEPDLHADSMQAPTLEQKGWHHHNPAGPVVLHSGSRVEVTGVFNYAERGLFLELAQEETGLGHDPITARPRCRIRIMVETPATDPPAQEAEALDLIGKVLESPAAP